VLEKFGLVASCTLLLVQCGTRESTRLFSELDAFARKNHKNADGIEIQIPDQETVWGVFDEFAPGKIKSAIINRPEFLTEYNEKPGKDFPLSLGIKSDLQRFGILSRETYWPDDQKSREQRLPKSLAVAMTALLAIRVIGVLCLLGLGGWLAVSLVSGSHGDLLHLVPETVKSKQAELDQLRITQQYLTVWDKILTPRSQAWSAMDFFLALIPEGHDVVCARLKYSIRQSDAKPGGAAAGNGASGFMREWIIEGTCSDQGRDHLERLREGSTISTLLTSAAARLNDPSFTPSSDRIVRVVLREETNPQFSISAKSGALPYSFHLVVTQTFAGSDPLAIPLLPKPKPGKAT